jgi:hypothetical protein
MELDGLNRDVQLGRDLPIRPTPRDLVEDLAFALPLKVQLYADGGTCWETSFGVTQSRRNDELGFSGRMTAP